MSSPCALASAAAMVPMVSLERCMTGLHLEEIEADGTGFRALSAFLEHERSKVELKALMPEDAKEAVGHGVRAKRSKSGAISFDLLEVQESGHAALQ